MWRLDVTYQQTKMPYRYRRRRFTPRRHKFHFRKRRWPWRRRRWHYRKRRGRKVITQQIPKKTKFLTVRGFEILGINGSQINYIKKENTWYIEVRNVAPVNKRVEYLQKMIPIPPQTPKCTDQLVSGATYWDFVGGYSFAQFTFRDLLIRNVLGWNRFSEDISGYSFIKFLGYSFKLNRATEIDYLFRCDPHRGSQDWETPLIHPANLINMPFVTWVESVKRTHCCKAKIIKRKPPPDLISTWFDIEQFQNYYLTGYQWTIFNPNNPMGKNPIIKQGVPGPITNDWMNIPSGTKIVNYCPPWMDRTKYDNEFVNYVNTETGGGGQGSIWDWLLGTNKKGKYSPFLPPLYGTENVNTIWIQYKFHFKVGGAGIGRYPQKYPIQEAAQCNPCGQNCTACIRPGELDNEGFIKEKAFQRIIGLPEYRRKRILEKLARIIQHRRKQRRVHWWDEKET
ncbi:ORF1 [Grizzly bear anellovirus 5]|nr:ORF1 [Grizzly bear anellovirus 5]